MTMRAVVERNTASGTDAHGHPVAPVFTAHATLPCFVWSRQRREAVDGAKTALVEDMRGIFPLAADIAEADEIASVTDRRGVELLSGRVRIDAIQRKHRHLEAALKRVQ
jgi:hypothetical protein